MVRGDKEKMGKCPQCKNEIDYFYVEEEGITLLTASLNGNELEYQESDWKPSKYGAFVCPKCNTEVAESEDEAIKILRQE